MDAPNSNYEKFFKKFEDIETLNVKDWNKTLILAYFCKKYKEKYGHDYKFKFNTEQPSKCFEVFVINKLTINLSSDPEILKTYIDFIFDTKIKNAKRKITSINTLDDQNFLFSFKNKFLKGSVNIVIDRTTKLQDSVIEKIKHVNENILTYGDLAFIMQAGGDQASKIKDVLCDFNFKDLERVV